MADGTGAAPAAGDAGAAGAASGTGTPAAGDTGAANAAQGGTPPAGTGAGTAAVAGEQITEAPWYGSDLTPEDIGWLQTKAWYGLDIAKAKPADGFAAMVKSQRSLETVLGRNRLAVPKDAADTEGWNNVWSALGRPADPAGYELKAPEGGDQALTDSIAAMAFKHGLTKNQVQGMLPELTARANEAKAAAEAAAEQTYINNSSAEFETLRQSWGGQADAKMAAAQRAKVALGLEPAIMDKMERAIGTTQMLTMLSNVGMAFSEDSGAGHGNQAFSAMTPEAARAKISELSKDSAWQEKYRAGDAEAVALKRQLDQALAAGM